MMNRLMLGILCGALLLSAQAKKPPQPKSQKEVDAIMAMQNAPDPDARAAAAEKLIAGFADTEFKSYALQTIAFSAREKNDTDKMIIYAERALEADPQAYQSMLLIATGLASRTREFDLDKEQKLTKSDKYANDALAAIVKAEKPNPQIPDADWEQAKKEMQAEAHEALGMSNSVRKKYDVSVGEYKQAYELAPQNSATLVRLGQTYALAGQYDEAIASYDKAIGTASAPAQVKQIAQQQKDIAVKAKAAKK